MNNPVTGFSKLSKKKNKLDCQEYFSTPSAILLLQNYWNSDEKVQSYTMSSLET
jgi:hypothetical protein